MNFAQARTAGGILFTDEYQLTMAQVYFRAGKHEQTVQFDHYFRSYPDYGKHEAGYCIAAGLEWLLDWMKDAYFREEDIAYLAGEKTSKGQPLFDKDFLEYLRKNGNFSGLTLRAIPEGRVAHPHIPLSVVEGPLLMAQILESSLLNHLNYQTLIATKASRIRDSAQSRMLLEFGMRRAQAEGANAGSRAALIGGCDYSSNVGISHVLGFPPRGTHAHSMVQFFKALGGSELDAFQAYADVYPDDCLLLVDTINTLESGVPNAIKVFEKLRAKGHEPVGIRIDSGDLAYLSIQAARMLNEAKFPKTSIVLSNELDELVIWQIQTQIQEESARYGVEPQDVLNRLVYGVGTNLVTSEGSPALGGVYKLVAVKEQDKWVPAIKISETPLKTPNPGHKQGWRVYDKRGMATADLLSLEDEDPRQATQIFAHHPTDQSKTRVIRSQDIGEIEPLLVDVLKEGKLVYDLPSIEQMREARKKDIARLDPGVRRLLNPHVYHVSLTDKLWKLKQELIADALKPAEGE